MLPTPEDKHEAKAVADIEEFGLHIMHVMEEDDLPNFSYSIGLWHSFNIPEVIIIGLKRDVSG